MYVQRSPLLSFSLQVTFHERVQARSVTLSGDVFDPAGTLTGGAADKGARRVLAMLSGLKGARGELAEVERELAHVSAQLVDVGRERERERGRGRGKRK